MVHKRYVVSLFFINLINLKKKFKLLYFVDLNPHSSRSHLVIVKRFDSSGNESKLCYVDLAGNEPDWETQNDREKNFINRSNSDLLNMLRNGVKNEVTTAAYGLGKP